VKLQVGVLYLPKAGATAAEYEDSFDYSAESGIVAISDGASNNFESRSWARLLTSAFVNHPPTEFTAHQLLDWVDSVAAEWSEAIPWQDLTVFEETKAALGSAATLVGLKFESPALRKSEGSWQCLALGDSCLFQIARGQLVKSLPIANSGDFDIHPPLLSTRTENSKLITDQLVTAHGGWRAGDTFYLLTDAIAAWFLLEFEQGGSPWNILSALDEQSFASFVAEKRAQKLMRNDDVTVVAVSVPARSAARRREPRDAVADAAARSFFHRASLAQARGTDCTTAGESQCL
jgi:Protein phosphatase 2C